MKIPKEYPKYPKDSFKVGDIVRYSHIYPPGITFQDSNFGVVIGVYTHHKESKMRDNIWSIKVYWRNTKYIGRFFQADNTLSRLINVSKQYERIR